MNLTPSCPRNARAGADAPLPRGARRGRGWLVAGALAGMIVSGRAAESPTLADQQVPEQSAPAEEPPPPPPSPHEDFRPRNREARLVRAVPPEYPPELAGSGVSGDVMLSVMIDRLGRASHVRVEDSPDEAFTAAALDAVAQWEFLPRLRDGRVSNSRMRLTVFVAEELGDLSLYDYKGGRISLEALQYGADTETPLRRLFGLRPAYPFDMLVDRKAGEVVIDCLVGEDGMPSDITIVEATHREFAWAAQGALVHWRYSPAMYRGRVVPARLRYRMSFQPDELDENLLALAKSLRTGEGTGLVSARAIEQQPRVSRSITPSFYDGTNNAPRRRRVTVNIVVTEEGEVRLPRIETAPDPLSGYIALAAVGYWHFTPARLKDLPVAVDVSLPITF